MCRDGEEDAPSSQQFISACPGKMAAADGITKTTAPSKLYAKRRSSMTLQQIRAVRARKKIVQLLKLAGRVASPALAAEASSLI